MHFQYNFYHRHVAKEYVNDAVIFMNANKPEIDKHSAQASSSG